MSDQVIDKLGNYFVYHNVHIRYGITFERFVEMVRRDTWKDLVGYAS